MDEHEGQTPRVPSQADQRDRAADSLDVEADERDMRANFHGWLHDEDPSGEQPVARRAAARERFAARDVRAAVAHERHKLDDDGPGHSDSEDDSSH